MQQVTITLSDERMQQLRQKADASGQTVSEVIEAELASMQCLARDRLDTILEAAWAHADRSRPDATDEEVMSEALAIEREIRERPADVGGN